MPSARTISSKSVWQPRIITIRTTASPWGIPYATFPGLWRGTGQSVFISMLPQFENQSIFNAYNFWHTSYDVWNATVLATGVSTLWCPSDGTITRTFTNPTAIGGPVIVRFTNYAACTGTWGTEAYGVPLVYPNPAESYPLWNQIHACMNGMFCLCYSIPISAITDGTSNTIAFGERANGLETLGNGDERDNWCWWSDGATGDTLFHSLFPINPFKKVAPDRRRGGHHHVAPVGVELPPGRSELRIRRRLRPFPQGFHQLLAVQSDHGLSHRRVRKQRCLHPRRRLAGRGLSAVDDDGTRRSDQQRRILMFITVYLGTFSACLAHPG